MEIPFGRSSIARLAGISGYFQPSDMPNAYEWNGILYSQTGWNNLIAGLRDEAKAALAEQIVQANPALSYDEVYAHLQYDHTTGGNADFAYLGDISDLAFLPGADAGGGTWSRYGSAPSIHMDDGFVHLDTVNPFWAVPLGTIGHGLFEFVFGHINPSVPMVHN